MSTTSDYLGIRHVDRDFAVLTKFPASRLRTSFGNRQKLYSAILFFEAHGTDASTVTAAQMVQNRSVRLAFMQYERRIKMHVVRANVMVVESRKILLIGRQLDLTSSYRWQDGAQNGKLRIMKVISNSERAKLVIRNRNFFSIT